MQKFSVLFKLLFLNYKSVPGITVIKVAHSRTYKIWLCQQHFKPGWFIESATNAIWIVMIARQLRANTRFELLNLNPSFVLIIYKVWYDWYGLWNLHLMYKCTFSQKSRMRSFYPIATVVTLNWIEGNKDYRNNDRLCIMFNYFNTQSNLTDLEMELLKK